MMKTHLYNQFTHTHTHTHTFIPVVNYDIITADASIYLGVLQGYYSQVHNCLYYACVCVCVCVCAMSMYMCVCVCVCVCLCMYHVYECIKYMYACIYEFVCVILDSCLH